MNVRDQIRLFKKCMQDKGLACKIDIFSMGFYCIISSYSSLRFTYNSMNEMFECKYTALNKNGNKSRKTLSISLSDYDKCFEDIMLVSEKIKEYQNYVSLERSKRKQINALSSIVISGALQKYPILTKAFDAKTRGAKNFCKKTFKDDVLILETKLRIKDPMKLVKIFEALEEALKE